MLFLRNKKAVVWAAVCTHTHHQLIKPIIEYYTLFENEYRKKGVEKCPGGVKNLSFVAKMGVLNITEPKTRLQKGNRAYKKSTASSGVW